MNRLFSVALRVGLAVLVLAPFGCGGDDDSGDGGSSGGHGHIEIGATAPVGGSLGMDVPVGTFEVTEGEQVGSLTLWSGTDPGLATVESDDQIEGLYVLQEGIPVSLEIVALDPGVRFQFEGTTLDAPGESVEIGPVPFHTSGQWQVVLPEGVTTGEYGLSFRLTAASTYGPSDVAAVTLVPSEGHHGDEDDEHDR